MSYGCKISFKQIEAEEIYDFLVSVKQELLNNFNSIAEGNFAYCPSIRRFHKSIDELSYEQLEICDSWIKTLFTFRYYYLKNSNILAVYGVPRSIESYFDKTIDFQNSCDQDYDRDCWEGVKLFESIYDKWMNISREDFISKVSDTYSIDNNYNEEDLEYYRKSSAYSEIWSKLENSLYDENSVIYFSLFGYYDLTTIRHFLQLCNDLAIKHGFIKEVE